MITYDTYHTHYDCWNHYFSCTWYCILKIIYYYILIQIEKSERNQTQHQDLSQLITGLSGVVVNLSKGVSGNVLM